MLTQSSIRVIRGAAGDIDTAVARYLAGELSDNTAAVCSHHHGEHGASHSCDCSGGCHR
ncbi:MAG: NifB/NifX family molybdenum-iron cluster-binding protein [Oscillospiraceae bacterium]